SAAQAQVLDQRPVEVELVGIDAAGRIVVGVAVGQAQVQRVRQRPVVEQGHQRLDIGLAYVGAAAARAARRHADDRALLQQAVGPELVAVAAPAQAGGEAQLAGRQLEQSALHVRL